jgi:hypothetical protein
MLRRLLGRLWPRRPAPAPPVGDIARISEPDEEALVDRLILDGWEQGCWLPDGIGRHSLDAAAQRALFVACAGRRPLHRETALAERGPIPETRPQDLTPPDDQVWLVTTQRCDLIKGLSQEPVVGLVRAARWLLPEARDRTRRSASLFIARIEGGWAWVADFRETIVVPKTALNGYPARQCLPDGDDARRGFALALAQRTWRRPVPLDIQRRVQEPLEKRHRSAGKTGEWARFFAAAAQILVERDEVTGRMKVHAVLGDDIRDEAWVGRFFATTVLPFLAGGDGGWLDEEGSLLIPADQLTMRQVFGAYKLDLDYASASRGGSPPDY